MKCSAEEKEFIHFLIRDAACLMHKDNCICLPESENNSILAAKTNKRIRLLLIKAFKLKTQQWEKSTRQSKISSAKLR